MSEKNLPIKIVLPKNEDIYPNKGGGDVKFFGEVTEKLQMDIANKFENLMSFYEEVFDENDNVPAVGKIIVKPEVRLFIWNNSLMKSDKTIDEVLF